MFTKITSNFGGKWEAPCILGILFPCNISPNDDGSGNKTLAYADYKAFESLSSTLSRIRED